MAEAQTPEVQGTPGRDVFISYASQDKAVADAIVEALERNGLRCWIAPRDVRPGTVYADAIVGAINDAKALVLVLSVNAMPSAHVGREVERAASKHKQLIAFRVDTTPLSRELEYFLSNSQWIDVPQLGMSPALTMLAESVRQRTGTGSATVPGPAALTSRKPDPDSWRSKAALFATIALLGAALAYLVANRFVLSKRGAEVETQSGAATQNVPAAAAVFNPPPHSIAVLPFVNMSGDSKQDYFSDGLSEELLNSLVTIRDLQVAARTSSFYFKGKDVDLAEIAHKLNVGAILEGSVRREGNHVRITAQLISTVTGFHLWSQTYDRDLKNVLALQTEIATAVTHALQATLVPDAAANIELGGTQNPQAFDAFLRGERLTGQLDAVSLRARIAAYEDATHLDPNFAKAYAGKSLALQDYWGYIATTAEQPDYERRLVESAQKALSLAPDLARGHVALATHLLWTYHFERARQEIARALVLSPGDVVVLAASSSIDAILGFAGTAIANAQRSVNLDPLNAHAYGTLGSAYFHKHQYRQAIEAYEHALALDSKIDQTTAFMGLSYIELGDLDSAIRTCATPPLTVNNDFCLAIAYRRQGHSDKAQDAVAKMQREIGDAAAAQFVMIYAQWGDIPRALDWLDTAYRLRDPGLAIIRSAPFCDPLRKEPRFQAIESKLNFPK